MMMEDVQYGLITVRQLELGGEIVEGFFLAVDVVSWASMKEVAHLECLESALDPAETRIQL